MGRCSLRRTSPSITREETCARLAGTRPGLLDDVPQVVVMALDQREDASPVTIRHNGPKCPAWAGAMGTPSCKLFSEPLLRHCRIQRVTESTGP